MRRVYVRETFGEELIFDADTGNVLKRVTRGETFRWPEGNDRWVIRGAYQRMPFGRLRFVPLPDLLRMCRGDKGNGFLYFTNGKKRFHLADRDHGTARVHGERIEDLAFLD